MHVLHSTNVSLCTTFNRDEHGGTYDDGATSGPRQMFMERIPQNGTAGSRAYSPPLSRYRPFRSRDECVAALGAADGLRSCLLGTVGSEPSVMQQRQTRDRGFS